MNFKFLKNAFIVIFISISINAFGQSKLITANVDSRLYVGEGDKQPLVVGLGGSEGGNAWDSDYWKKQEINLLQKAMHF